MHKILDLVLETIILMINPVKWLLKNKSKNLEDIKNYADKTHHRSF